MTLAIHLQLIFIGSLFCLFKSNNAVRQHQRYGCVALVTLSKWRIDKVCGDEDAQQLSLQLHFNASTLAPYWESHPLSDEMQRFVNVSNSRPFNSHSRAVAEILADSFHQHTLQPEAQAHALTRVRRIFTHAYDNYMSHAFPAAELLPYSCTGGPFELIKIPAVTLIDAMDTLVVMGNYSEFRRAVTALTGAVKDFDYDVPVSIFETTIRVLGGLLSAHLFAVDEAIGIYKVSLRVADNTDAFAVGLSCCFDLFTGMSGRVRLLRRRAAAAGEGLGGSAAARLRHADGHTLRYRQPAQRSASG